MRRHWHFRQWSWKPWTPPIELVEELHSQGWVIEVSKRCTYCHNVQFRMTRRHYL